ncbi:Putative ribonuclease H protein [Dendrobium catenatum]|uniref:Ribonuclease H protein n=1 Tax=Dendrobium catenatum TaxID=906689 RepID=A0A2I0VEI4_9ASPA|nr:Putative ribonuclease H protein [Dendrobium catenatum]
MVASNFQPLLEAAASRLNTWGKRCISLEGRLILVKSTFFSLPLFLSTLSLVPLSILKEFDKMCRGFLWSKNNGKAGLHYVSWDLLCRPKIEGGRGLFSAILMVGSLRAKFAWNFFTKPNSLLNHILKAKYGGDVWSGTVKQSVLRLGRLLLWVLFFFKKLLDGRFPTEILSTGCMTLGF